MMINNMIKFIKKVFFGFIISKYKQINTNRSDIMMLKCEHEEFKKEILREMKYISKELKEHEGDNKILNQRIDKIYDMLIK